MSKSIGIQSFGSYPDSNFVTCYIIDPRHKTGKEKNICRSYDADFKKNAARATRRLRRFLCLFSASLKQQVQP